MQSIPIQHPRMGPHPNGPILGQLEVLTHSKLPILPQTDSHTPAMLKSASFSDEQVKLSDQQCHLSFHLTIACGTAYLLSQQGLVCESTLKQRISRRASKGNSLTCRTRTTFQHRSRKPNQTPDTQATATFSEARNHVISRLHASNS